MPGQRQEPCTASRAQPPKALGISLVPGHRRSGYLACRTGTAPGIAAPEEPWEARWIHRRTSEAFTGRRHAGPRAACAAKASPLRQAGTAAVREPTPACSPDRAASTFQRSSVSCEPYRPLLWRGAGRRDRRITLSGQRASPDARWRLTPPVDRFATLALPLQRSGFSFRSSPARVTARRHRPRCHTVATSLPPSQTIPPRTGNDRSERWYDSRTMHLHGFFFMVLDDAGDPVRPLEWKDTVDIPHERTVRLAVRFDERPGTWIFHCHILDHADGGLLSAVSTSTCRRRISGTSPNTSGSNRRAPARPHANGFRTVTPAKFIPACRSSDRTSGQSPRRAASTIAASQ